MSREDSSLSPAAQAPVDNPVEEDSEMLDVDQDDQEDEEMQTQEAEPSSAQESRPPREARKDKDINSFLNSMDKYAPIVLDVEIPCLIWLDP
jgi:hypothetical protein